MRRRDNPVRRPWPAAWVWAGLIAARVNGQEESRVCTENGSDMGLTYFTLFPWLTLHILIVLAKYLTKGNIKTEVIELRLMFTMITFWSRKISTWKVPRFHKDMQILNLRNTPTPLFLHLVWLFCWETQLIAFYFKYI